ncbi:MAG: DNA polymerase I [Endomicrobium sp.]|jgi:DNA polymerase-1|nr:DNA polymerase I [Endomicrobium sp.]
MKRFFVIDGNAYIHRAYHALPSLFTSSGQQINAVYGFMRLLFKIKNNFTPDYIVVCFDYPSKNFRYEIFEDYKANRNSLDEALISQMPIAKEAVEALAMAKIEIKGYEADDLIATVVENNKKINMQTVIVTADKDISQLAEEQSVLIWNDSKNIMYDAKKIEEMYGVMPKQLVDVFALMGDVVDNVPGIRGIGEKTAVKLVKRFGTLENILQNLDFIEGNVGKLVRYGKDKALISKKLVDLNKHVPLSFELENFKSRDLDVNKAIPFFEKYEFKSFLKKYSYQYFKNFESHIKKLKKKNDCNSIASIIEGANVERQEIDFLNSEDKKLLPLNSKILNTPFEFDNEVVNTKEKAIKIAKLIECSGIFAMKTIKSLSDSLETYVVGISLYTESKAFYFPIGHSDLNSPKIAIDEFKDIFTVLFSSNRIKKIGYNLKHERNIYKILKIELNGIYFDVMLASYCLNPAKPNDINYIATKYLNFKAGDDSYLRRGTKKFAFADSSVEDNARYANSISAASFAAYKIFSLLIKEKKLSSLFFDVEMPLIEILSEMEISGVKIDSSFLSKFNEKVISKLEEIEDNIYKTADVEFNINSTKQLSRIMFDKLNLPIIKKTKTGYSTNEEVLTELSSYEFPAMVLKYRELQKLKSTYISPIMSYCACSGDRIHTVFNQAVTVTGRLSSTEPNLQNIPMRSVYGREFRKAFIPENDKIFLSADYSQIDLRVLAHISQDEKLVEAFRNNVDVHSATAREVFNIPQNESVPDNLRKAAKAINFGIIYGMSPFGLSRQLSIPFSKARKYIDGYFERYSGVKLWMDQIIEQASRDGYVCTINGRVRFVHGLYSKNTQVRSAAERIVLNTPIQGSSADIIKIAMINIYNEIKFRGYKSIMLLQIHDDLLFEVPIEELRDIISIIKNKMENSVALSVPLIVDVKVGKNLGEMKKYDNRINRGNCYWEE